MLNRKEVHNSETLNIQIDSHDQKSYLIELCKDCTKFDLNVECLENSFSKFFILNHAESACELNINMVLKQDANCQMGGSRKKHIEMESLCGSKRAGG